MPESFRKWLPLVLCSAFLAGISMSQAQETPKSKEPVAVVAGQAIYDEDLEAAGQGQLARLRNQEYDVKSKALENLIQQKLLEAEAKKKGVAPDKLLAQEVNSKVGDPTDAEVEAYYLGQKDRLNRPLEEVKAQLRASLKLAKIQQAQQDYLKRLRDSSEVAIYLERPKIEVGYDPLRLRGNANAPVVIVEFADFQCPYCRREQAVLKALTTKYGNKVSVAYRDFPLRQIHAQAQPAAEAARCAGEQGKFWEYHDLLFAETAKLDAASLMDYAAQAGLDKNKFNECLSSGKFKPAIDEDLRAGEKLGVSGTPAFFINGVFLSGAQPMSEFEKMIDAELAAREQRHVGQMMGAVAHPR
jgi:protein-disulfide isomerase